MTKLIRITTISGSLRRLLIGQLRFMNKYYEVIGIASPGEPIKDIVTNEGIRVHPIEMTRTINPIKDLIALVQLIAFIRKEKPTIVHTHTPKAGTLGMLAALLCQVPVRMHTVAGLPLMEADGAKRKILNFVEKLTYACATRAYPNSFGLYDFIVQSNFCKPDKLKVIGNGSSNGIDTNYFSIESVTLKKIAKLKTDYDIRIEDFVFIYIGRLVKDKGINELIAAFYNLSIKNKNVKLLLVGKQEPELDPLKEETLVIIRNNPSIVFVDYQMDVRPYLAISNILTFPSYREGFPNVPMQAGAMGLPCIVTDINGCNEIITHEYNGLIIPPKNTEALEKAMQQIIDDETLTKKLASNARESIVSRFDQQTLWELIKEEYGEQLQLAGIRNE